MEFIAVGAIVALFFGSAFLFCETSEGALVEKRRRRFEKRRKARRNVRRQLYRSAVNEANWSARSWE